MSSSVVVVNITRSVTRRTNKATELSLLGWSLLQDLTGVIVGAIVLLPALVRLLMVRNKDKHPANG